MSTGLVMEFVGGHFSSSNSPLNSLHLIIESIAFARANVASVK